MVLTRSKRGESKAPVSARVGTTETSNSKTTSVRRNVKKKCPDETKKSTMKGGSSDKVEPEHAVKTENNATKKTQSAKKIEAPPKRTAAKKKKVASTKEKEQLNDGKGPDETNKSAMKGGSSDKVEPEHAVKKTENNVTKKTQTSEEIKAPPKRTGAKKKKVASAKEKEQVNDGKGPTKVGSKGLKKSEICDLLNQSDEEDDLKESGEEQKKQPPKRPLPPANDGPKKKISRKQQTKSKALTKNDIASLLDEDHEDSNEEELEEDEKEETTKKEVANTRSIKRSKIAKNKQIEIHEDSDDDEVSFSTEKKPSMGKRPLKDRTNSTADNISVVSTKSNDDNVSLVSGMSGKSIPIYKRQNVHQEKPVVDVFDVDAYGEDEFGPEEQGKKKKRKAPKRKKKAITDILLTFGNEKKEEIQPIVKKLKNLKTPAPKVKVIPAVRNLNPIRLPPSSPRPFLRAPSSPARSHLSAASGVSSPHHYSEMQSPGYAGFSRDCDDYLPSEVQEPSSVHSCTADVDVQSFPHKSYKTPRVPKVVGTRGVHGKVSTPRLEDGRTEGQTEVPISTEIKKCFGFDTDSEESDNETLDGISPVKGDNVTYFANSALSSTSTLYPQSSRLSTMMSPSYQKAKEGPYRFTGIREPQFRRPVQKATSSRPVNKDTSKIIAGNFGKTVRQVPEKENSQQPTHPTASEKEIESAVQSSSKKNAFEVLKERKGNPGKAKNEKLKKKTKKVKDNLIQTRIFDDLAVPEEEPQGKEEIGVLRSVGTKGGSENANPEQEAKAAPPTKSHAHHRRSYTKKSIEVSVAPSSPKMNKKARKQFDSWATNQTMHFSEVDEFDLSFT